MFTLTRHSCYCWTRKQMTSSLQTLFRWPNSCPFSHSWKGISPLGDKICLVETGILCICVCVFVHVCICVHTYTLTHTFSPPTAYRSWSLSGEPLLSYGAFKNVWAQSLPQQLWSGRRSPQLPWPALWRTPHKIQNTKTSTNLSVDQDPQRPRAVILE